MIWSFVTINALLPLFQQNNNTERSPIIPPVELSCGFPLNNWKKLENTQAKFHLVGGYYIVNMDHFPNFRGENNNQLKPPDLVIDLFNLYKPYLHIDHIKYWDVSKFHLKDRDVAFITNLPTPFFWYSTYLFPLELLRKKIYTISMSLTLWSSTFLKYTP